MYVNDFFDLSDETIDLIQDMKPKFGYNGFGEFVFHRTYSRTKPNGFNETWNDVVIRVMEGVLSIRKDWYLKNRIVWDDARWQLTARNMAVSMFQMKWMPPGRGLWAMGTPFVYEHGSMALNNCGFTVINSDHRMSEDFAWMMDALMLGVGVGFEPTNAPLKLNGPRGSFIYQIPDSREGWVNSVRLLIDSYTLPNLKRPVFDYSLIRKRGLPIRGFGGLTSGPDPLTELHIKITNLLVCYMQDQISVVRLKTDIGNLIGCCVVAGNVRRSAEIAIGNVNDQEFMDLKDYTLYPERANFGWMSNNAVKFYNTNDFEKIGEVSRRVVLRGEPGGLNMKNIPHGRIGKFDPVRIDKAVGLNPCGEIPLEDKELCNLACTLPTMCSSDQEWLEACEYATIYASTTSLLPTHQPATNAVVNRNRRIGVDIIDFTGWKHERGLHKCIASMRKGYSLVRQINQQLNAEAGVPEAIRVTTVKPGGTVPKLAGKTAGLGHPTYHHTQRRVRVAIESPVVKILKDSNVPNHPDQYDPKTLIFEFPILQGPAKPAGEVSLWEQAVNLMVLQAEWADNAVSNTLYFRPKWELIGIYSNRRELIEKHSFTQQEKVWIDKDYACDRYKIVWTGDKVSYFEFDPAHEEDIIEYVLSSFIGKWKSFSLLPHSSKGAYVDMPEEGITKEQYDQLLAKISPIDWSQLSGSDGEDEKFCQGDRCELQLSN